MTQQQAFQIIDSICSQVRLNRQEAREVEMALSMLRPAVPPLKEEQKKEAKDDTANA